MATSQYPNIDNGGAATFPNPLVDPRKKGYDFILQYSRAAWANGKAYIPATMFYFGRSRLAEIRQYALGKQSINKYKKLLLGDDMVDKSSMNIDWNPPSFLTKFREIAISKILQRDFEVECFAIDPLAKSEEDAYFNQMKVKIMMMEAAQQMGADTSQLTVLQPQQGEPSDMEQLQIQMKYGYKHQRAMEAELGISLIQQQNDIAEKRKRTVENLFDFGLGGYKEWIDENGMVKFREIVPENIITSYCLKNDFSDMVHCGEVLYISVADLAPYFTPEQLDYLCKNVAGKYGNPGSYPLVATTTRQWDRFKVAVFDLEFIDFDTTVYKKEIDNRGNIRINKADFSNYGREDEIKNSRGEAEPKYMNTTRKVVRRTKWIIGTSMMYDYGLADNMKRKPSSWWDTSLSYHLYSWNFYNMTFGGITERLMPIEDKLCLTWYKLQNLSNKLIPYLIKLDINALEGVNFGKGGTKMTPADLVDFMMQEFVVLYRSSDLLTRNPNYDPARVEATGQLAAFKMLYEELQANIQLMRDITGLNELTDGSTPNAKTLVPVAEAAMQSTNNALYLISNADKMLMNKLSDGIIQRIQVAVKLGKVEGYAKALGTDTVKFYQINPSISNYELGIFTREAPTYAEKQQLLQDLNIKDSQGLLDPSDKIIIMSCTNLKQAAELLAYTVEKRRAEQQQNQLQIQQQTAQSNAQASIAIEQAKQQTLSIQHQFEMERINAQMQWQYIIEEMKKTSDREEAGIQSQGKIEANHVVAQAKIIAQSIASESEQNKQRINNESQEKQKEMASAAQIVTKHMEIKNRPKKTA